MLDINFIRENPELVKKATTNKRCDPTLVEQVLRLDEKRRKLIGEVEKLREEKNAISDEIKPAMAGQILPVGRQVAKIKSCLSADRADIRDAKLEILKEKSRMIKSRLDDVEPQLIKVEQDLKELLLRIPNPALPDVKVGKDDTENEVIRKWGEPTKFDFQPKDHLTLGKALDIIDVKRASKVSGARFAYLKGDAVLLQYSLVQLAFEVLLKECFIPVVPPVLISRKSMSGMGYLEYGEEDMFVLPKDDIILVGTSEQAIGPMHANEIFDKKDLPRRYMGLSPCFRREAGSYGKDTRGILRLHQFDKVEMFSFTTPENGDAEHEYFLSLEEKLYQMLNIPYQVVKICTGDLGAPAARKYDIEAWMPGQNKYREVTSTSTTTDFQARRLNIKFRPACAGRDGAATHFVHMLNGTAFAMGRTIISILENYQEKDGTITIPAVLQKYMGKKIINITDGKRK